MTERSFPVSINGQIRTVRGQANMPLVYLLRNDCGLMATRFGCGVGQCGACHILLDGVSVPACNTPLAAVEGKEMITVEGLAEDGQLHALQQAFIDEQAAQCGYCLSGILISAVALLRRNPKPTDTQVRQALDVHLCRCGSHNRIVRAVMRAASKSDGVSA